ADRLLPIEQLGLQLVVAELELPAFVIERNDLTGGVSLLVQQRCEQYLRAESFPVIANRPHRPGSWQRSIRGTRVPRHVHLHELVALAEPPENAPRAVRLRTCQPVTVQPAHLDAEKHRRREKAS